MSLSDLASIGTFVSGLAIVVSLIYAALQFRLYAAGAHESRLIAYSADIQRFRMSIVENPEVARIYRDGLDDMTSLSSIDQWRFGALMQTLVTNFALAIEFKDIGAATDVERSIHWIMGRPGARAWWPKARHMYAPSVVSAIDHAVGESDQPIEERQERRRESH